jgi:hypothetical protein
MQEYAKAALNNTTEAVAFYGKHLNDSQFHAARDIANLPVTEWASFASLFHFQALLVLLPPGVGDQQLSAYQSQRFEAQIE